MQSCWQYSEMLHYLSMIRVCTFVLNTVVMYRLNKISQYFTSSRLMCMIVQSVQSS